MTDWTGDPVMLAFLRRSGLLAEAERLWDAIERGDTDVLGPALSAEEVIARMDDLCK